MKTRYKTRYKTKEEFIQENPLAYKENKRFIDNFYANNQDNKEKERKFCKIEDDAHLIII